jgi:hypothetical protein
MDFKEKKMKNKIIVGIVFAVVLFFACSFVQAELITIALTGQVYMLDDAQHVFGGQIHYGDTITGTYTYDTSTPNSEQSTSEGVYWHYSAPYGVSFTVDGFNFRTDSDNVLFSVGIGDNIPTLGDIYSFDSHNNLPLSNGVSVNNIAWQLTDSSKSALSSDALPTTAPNLANWDMDYGLNVSGGSLNNNYFHLVANITSATVVPEPATLLLMVSGLLLLRKTNS